MKKIKSKKIKYFLGAIVTLFLFFTLYPIPYPLTPILAQAPACQNNNRSEGLISTQVLSGKFGNQMPLTACVIGSPSIFTPFKIPTYDDLKSLYFDQSKASHAFIGTPTNQGNLAGAINSGYQVVTTTNLGLNGEVVLNPGVETIPFVVFVDGNLLFDTNFTYGNSNAGMVFVVKGDININQGVTRIDAVLISSGTIYTAGAGCASSSVDTSQLTINGSLISLTETSPIKFCRKLSNNALPAEKIIHQSKYLIILKDIFADTYQKWSEIQ